MTHVKSFIAGAISAVVFHQAVLWLLLRGASNSPVVPAEFCSASRMKMFSARSIATVGLTTLVKSFVVLVFIQRVHRLSPSLCSGGFRH